MTYIVIQIRQGSAVSLCIVELSAGNKKMDYHPNCCRRVLQELQPMYYPIGNTKSFSVFHAVPGDVFEVCGDLGCYGSHIPAVKLFSCDLGMATMNGSVTCPSHCVSEQQHCESAPFPLGTSKVLYYCRRCSWAVGTSETFLLQHDMLQRTGP